MQQQPRLAVIKIDAVPVPNQSKRLTYSSLGLQKPIVDCCINGVAISIINNKKQRLFLKQQRQQPAILPEALLRVGINRHRTGNLQFGRIIRSHANPNANLLYLPDNFLLLLHCQVSILLRFSRPGLARQGQQHQQHRQQITKFLHHK